MNARRIPPGKAGHTEFTVEADEDEATAEAIMAEVWQAMGHPSKRCQVQIVRIPGQGWRVIVRRTFIGETRKDPHGDELEGRLRMLDRRGKRVV